MHINLSDIKNNRLKGFRAHTEMSPQCRKSLPESSIPRSVRHSSVLLLLIEKEEETSIVFIKRAASNGVHSRQISFPGGTIEETDNSAEEAAIRECREETGIKGSIKIIRKLTDLYVPPSNFLIHPYVGILKENNPVFIPNPGEVEKVFTENVTNFLDQSFRDTYYYYTKDKPCSAPCFISNGYAIWGATAMILNEFLCLISKKY